MDTLTVPRPALVAVLALAWLAPPATAQDAPIYDEGSVWAISYVRTEPGQFDNYMENLSQVWRRSLDMAQERGYIRSYRILSGQPSDRDDWDLMLLVEYPNMAALDDGEAKYAPIRQAVIGSLVQTNEADRERGVLREIVGGKLARELVFKE